ncbi:unnamed protein product [Cuscuta campestris]|uniref:Knottins-like domain-containing protein n=1 Tax=Cuscuta campestris TaxID=132261 RepID=A0A484LBB8_9ASTE|nr:unnamed protein product [Cuscuta campestris]
MGGRRLRSYAALFFFVIFFMATSLPSEMGGGMKMVAEGRTCESQSHKFKGPCLSDTNCASVCKTEGFPEGHCRGLRRRCFCKKNC